MWSVLVRLFRFFFLPFVSSSRISFVLMQWGFSYSLWKNIRFDRSPIEMCVIHCRHHYCRWRPKGRSFYVWCEKRTVVASNAWGLQVMQSPQMNSNTIFTIYLPDSNKVCLLMWCVWIGVNKQLDLMTVRERQKKWLVLPFLRRYYICCFGIVAFILETLWCRTVLRRSNRRIEKVFLDAAIEWNMWHNVEIVFIR